MNIIAFPRYDDTAARIFTIMHSLERRSYDFTPREEIKRSLCMAWIDSPVKSKSPGSKAFSKAIKKANEDCLLVTERGPDGGYQITEKGRKLYFAELSARKYLNARILREKYRAYLWPQPPAPPALPLALPLAA